MTKDSADKKKLDDLLRRAENARQSADLPIGKGSPVKKPPAAANTNSADTAESPSVTENIATIADGMRKTGKKLGDIKEAAMGFWDKAGPVAKAISWPFMQVGKAWGAMWHKHAYKTDKETGERRISRNRAGAILSATFLAAVALTPTIPGEMVRDWTIDPVIDAPVMMLTTGTETLYNVKTEETSPDVYRLQGCFTQVCGPSNTGTYNIESRVSHGIWKIMDQGNPFFITDRMAAAVPPGQNRCEITSYSARFRAAKYLQIFPQVLDIQCVATGAGAPVVTP